jgi:hypothetical protein
MRLGAGILVSAVILLSVWEARGAPGDDSPAIPLTVPSGAPLRLYLTRKVSKRVGAPVQGKIIESLFAFDREVVPAGSLISGKVSSVQPLTKGRRFQAMVNGDFTPLRNAQMQFDTITLADGKKLSLNTVEIMGLNSIYTEPSKKQKPAKAQPQTQNGGILGTAKQTAKDRINGTINARSRGIADIVRGPDKKEKLIDFLWAKLPYHPQYLRHGTRVDAPLRDPLQFGTETLPLAGLAQLGSQPSPDSVVRARLLTALDSATATKGQAVEAVVAAPLFSADHKLVMPEGTHLIGTVTVVKKARSFHRPATLRFAFQKVDLPAEVANLRPVLPAPAPFKTQAIVAGAEGNGNAPIKVDSEGGVQAQETKTRFIAPLISLVLARSAADTDADKHSGAGVGGANGNISGRTLGGGSGFGLLGAAAAQSSRYVGMAFGYYGLAWSVYSNVVAKGGEVQFENNAMMDIRFGARPAPAGSKYQAATGADGQ